MWLQGCSEGLLNHWKSIQQRPPLRLCVSLASFFHFIVLLSIRSPITYQIKNTTYLSPTSHRIHICNLTLFNSYVWFTMNLTTLLWQCKPTTRILLLWLYGNVQYKIAYITQSKLSLLLPRHNSPGKADLAVAKTDDGTCTRGVRKTKQQLFCIIVLSNAKYPA